MKHMMNDHLVLFDVDNIKGYVFATGRLKEIRGGSDLVERLTSSQAIESLIRESNLRAKVLYADGGAGKVRFSCPADAELFCRTLEQKYRTETFTGSLTTARVPYAQAIGPTVERGETALRQQKSDRRETIQLEGGPYVRFCESCGSYPIVNSYLVRAGLPRQALCRSCYGKRKHAEALANTPHIGNREQFEKEFLRCVPTKYQGLWQPDKVSQPDDVDDLGAVSQPQNYLGFLYCDGNGVGDHWRAIAQRPGVTDEDYTFFSNVLSEATREAAAEALAHCFPAPRRLTDGERLIPFEIIIMGGDDLVLLVAAHRALEVATVYCEAFKRLTAEKLAKRERLSGCRVVTASAGVILAHASQPILYLERRADELLRSAKRARESGQEGAVDFLVVSTPTLNPVNRVRREEGYEDSDHFLRRTLRPYSAAILILAES
jgi:hypothetical protein